MELARSLVLSFRTCFTPCHGFVRAIFFSRHRFLYVRVHNPDLAVLLLYDMTFEWHEFDKLNVSGDTVELIREGEKSEWEKSRSCLAVIWETSFFGPFYFT